jgi:pimeloyl-ACP methyl ester carboxylesterase
LAVYVLVHGAWHGGWCWHKVAKLLRSEGNEVFTPTLTGLGDRSHLLNPNITLSTHIVDIINLFEYEDLNHVIIVGHSYAGMIISGIADKIPSRLKHLVYLDAFIPNDGESISDLHPSFVDKLKRIAREKRDGWLVPFPEEVINPKGGPLYGIVDARELIWLRERLTPHPLSCFEQHLHFKNPLGLALPKTYIWCSVRQGERTETWGFIKEARIAQELGWEFYEIESDHDVMITRPNELSNILLKIF